MKEADARRRELAIEAARLICEEGLRDYRFAKEKAMRRLGLSGRGPVPSNLEVDEAVDEHLKLFESDAGDRRRSLFDTAIRAMRLTREFEPRLTGDLLRGRVTRFTVICLHLFVDGSEQVDIFLGNGGIPFESGEKRFKRPDGGHIDVPTCEFMAGEHPIELALFQFDDLRWSPASVINGKPMARADLAAVERLVTQHGDAATPDDQRWSMPT